MLCAVLLWLCANPESLTQRHVVFAVMLFVASSIQTKRFDAYIVKCILIFFSILNECLWHSIWCTNCFIPASEIINLHECSCIWYKICDFQDEHMNELHFHHVVINTKWSIPTPFMRTWHDQLYTAQPAALSFNCWVMGGGELCWLFILVLETLYSCQRKKPCG